MNRPHAIALAASALLGLGAAVAATSPAGAGYPHGDRRWTHVMSMIIEPGHALAGLVEGTHHLYANEKALRGYRQRPFADGSVIVFDLLATVHGDKAISEGARKAVIVMRKDARRHAATGGWEYQVYGGADGRKAQLDAAAAQACHDCHTSQRARDFVFSDWRE
ncbi:MAG: cytochrome P460 family protein [Steroidobacteraceae bacterium]